MPTAIALKTAEIITQVLSDEDFAQEIQNAARKAVVGGIGSDDWAEYFSRFASSPRELAGLGSGALTDKCPTTTGTLTTLTTPICVTCTTATTTTTNP